ncbi:unnamed protein product [Vitrella brassicaformis CCMP3155]|uniref:Uncharacterized protein n=1 Tax=Vitrella brassicaformis (strain CCMP3155) TaxID=1169540 RepID=A0A0G4EG55_VITBC|nr:unnamed protein product [Vitrella brassicaformis CCMP3155]|eukprot:CEL94697.1 unnamed protein product [Vitrella brassicaformis CCMP3155]
MAPRPPLTLICRPFTQTDESDLCLDKNISSQIVTTFLALLVSFGLSVRAQAVVVISPHSLASDRGISCVCPLVVCVVCGGRDIIIAFGDGLTDCISVARPQTQQGCLCRCPLHYLSFVTRRPIRIRAAQTGHRSSHRLQYCINQ